MKTKISTHLKPRAFVLLCSLAIFSLARPISGQAADQAKPGPEHKKLEIWAGEWAYEGDGKESPFGPAGKFKGSETSKMVLNGFFLESRWKDTTDENFVAEGIVISGYDSVKKQYVEHGFDFDGIASSTVTTINGNVWNGMGTRADTKGKVYKTRFTRTLSSDGKSYIGKAEYSPDGGQTWKVMWELASKKKSS